MPERAYTVREIDALRSACRDKVLWGSYSGPDGDVVSQIFGRGEVESRAEEMVRTFMLAGLTARDLLASDER